MPSDLCPLFCRDRKSTGLKLSKKTRRRHTDVRSPQAVKGASASPCPSWARPFPSPRLGLSALTSRTRDGVWNEWVPLPHHCALQPSTAHLSQEPDATGTPPLGERDTGELPGTKAGWGDPCIHSHAGVSILDPGRRFRDKGHRSEETRALSGPKQGVLHPEI